MKTCKIAISMPIDILESIDKLAKKLQISRSKLLSEGARSLAKKYQDQTIASKYNEIYSSEKINKEQINFSESFLNLQSDIDDEY
jgi:metal-responsive CopG/Arc/MetJ family transcriptional regulator